jgi:tRNA nucleotidyltransferase (CCA-adding enzyme)
VERSGAGDAVVERLATLPGGPQLLALAARYGGVELVGGAVRDILLDRTPRELDVVVAEDAPAFAAALARDLGAEVQVIHHERFGTALVRWKAGEIDIATCRTETYSAPGALPDVAPGTPEQDLLRRDFTVNALAVALGGTTKGRLRASPFALEDLAERRLRVLHEHSFSEDPTRLLRLARYKARLGFAVEHDTARLAVRALSAGALNTVSGARIGAELRLALGEADAHRALVAMDALGLFSALHPSLRFDRALAQTALRMAAVGEEEKKRKRGAASDGTRLRIELLLLAVLLVPLVHGSPHGERGEARALLDELQFPAAERDIALRAAGSAQTLADELDRAHAPSTVYELASGLPVETVALAGAWAQLTQGSTGKAAPMARAWLETLRHVRQGISGEDLIAAGVPEGPEIGRRMDAAHRMLLDGRIEAGRDSELRAALGAEV